MPSGIYKRTEKHRLAIKKAMNARKWNYSGGYHAIHKWIYKNYGKAIRCENKDCLKKSNDFEWALLKNKEYDYKRNNFIQLCKSCHIKYDFTEKGREQLRMLNLGKKQSKEHICKRVKKLLGQKRSDEFRKKMREISIIREFNKKNNYYAKN